MTTNVTLTNRSFNEIVQAQVLVDTRLFEIDEHLASGETRSVQGHVLDRNHYDFKTNPGASRGCEIEQTIFADGTHWEAPTPI